MARIQRTRSDPHEPTISDRQREHLHQLVTDKVREATGVEDYDPVVAIALIANDGNNDVSTRLTAHARVAKFIHPELKQVEITGAGGGPLEVKHREVDELLNLLEGVVRKQGEPTT